MKNFRVNRVIQMKYLRVTEGDSDEIIEGG